MLDIKLFVDVTSFTHTYILGCKITNQAVILDSVLEAVPDYLLYLESLKLKLLFILETHLHADHITGAHLLRETTKAKTIVSHLANIKCADHIVKEGDKINFGKFQMEVIETPGHTPDSVSYKVGDHLFTGDCLFIGGCGRTDFQGGSAQDLWNSVTNKLWKLPPQTVVYPGHDYNGNTHSTIEIEKSTNPRFLNHSQETFITQMANLKLAPPHRQHEALPANKKCGKL